MEPHENEHIKPSLTRIFFKIFFKINFFAVLIVLIMLVVSAIGVGLFAYSKINNFSQAAEVTKSDLYQTLTTGWQQSPTQTKDHKNILLLGVDTLETRGNSKPLTDTMMLASINLKTGKITILSLPRDLWNEAYQTKINALYTYGFDKYPANPQLFPQEVIAEMTKIEIHHTVVISMQAVAEIIDLIGGIDVDVTQGFIDEEFPRPNIDVTVETDPKVLYQTIEFNPGLQTMNGEIALEYIRSRHGNNDQNTDLARSQRQQAVIKATINKLFDKKLLLNSSLMGQLYSYYLDNFAEAISPEELIAVSKILLPLKDSLELINNSVPIYPVDPKGTIEHLPVYLYDGQWTYSIRNQVEFEQDINNQLFNYFRGDNK